MTDWPDWTGRAVAIVASGPSVNKAEVAALEGRLPVLAIKRNVEVAPFAEVVYGCDYPWWRSVAGLPAFKGLKLSYAERACREWGLGQVRIPHIMSDEILLEEIGVVGAGGSSGFQALNLAVQWGATQVLLIGFDAHLRSGDHWYGRNLAQGMNNPSVSNCERWAKALNAAGGLLADYGVEVVNASLGSAVTTFRKATIADTLKDWGL